MAIDRARAALAQVFFQRCFYLFAAVLALVMAVLLLEPTPRGRVLLNAGNQRSPRSDAPGCRS
jgi:hypothetical protein